MVEHGEYQGDDGTGEARGDHGEHHGSRDHRGETQFLRPDEDKERGGQRDDHAVDEARTHFLVEHAYPMVGADLAQRESAHGDREGLCAGIAGLAGDDGR